MRLLLIEDDKATIKILGKKIEKLGLKFDFAETGSDAINYYRSKKYEIIVVDLRFPGKDVYEILLEVNLISPESKIIVYSSNLDEDTNNLLSGYDIYRAILKEAGHKTLISTIESLSILSI